MLPSQRCCLELPSNPQLLRHANERVLAVGLMIGSCLNHCPPLTFISFSPRKNVVHSFVMKRSARRCIRILAVSQNNLAARRSLLGVWKIMCTCLLALGGRLLKPNG